MCLSLGVLAPLLTVRLSPTIWTDEVQLIDFGRTFLPGADLRIGMSLMEHGQAYRGLSWVGPVLSEAGFRIAGGDPVGPRLVSLLGALAAAAAAFAWLRVRGSNVTVALACAALLLLDPLFAQGYRGARMDGWSIAFALACLRQVAASASAGADAPPIGGARRAVLLSSAGALLVVAGAIWPSAVILVPLVVFEFVRVVLGASGGPARGMVGGAMWIFVGGTAAAAAVWLPFAEDFQGMLADTRWHAEGASTWFGTGLSGRLVGLFGPLVKYSPLLLMMGLTSMLLMRSWVLAVATVAAAFIVMRSGPYGHRDVYLLPYFIVASAQGLSVLEHGWKLRFMRILAVAGVALGLAMTVLARNSVAWLERLERDPAQVDVFARTAIGPGAHRVYVGSNQLYYAARNLGWRFCRCWGWEDWKGKRFGDFIRTMDFVVLDRGSCNSELEARMQELGFSQIPLLAKSSDETSERLGAALSYGPFVAFRQDAGGTGASR